jgi:uracil-DNA glycosylase
MSTWHSVLGAQKQAEYFIRLQQEIKSQRQAGKIIYPPEQDVYKALTLTPLAEVKVVILGQDPYHGPHQAHGLSFSVPNGTKIPPSLRNIFKELTTDIEGFTQPEHGDLTAWAEQGVLLLNTVLTVEQGKAYSHSGMGWERFTDSIIDAVNAHCNGVVFLLWGKHAQNKSTHIDSHKHYVLMAPHPSPLSAHRGFFGCAHFSKTNALLAQQHKPTIQWQV